MIALEAIPKTKRRDWEPGKPLGTAYLGDQKLLRVVENMFKFGAGFACFGTLLGLVRDGRLIPEDNDLDYYVTNQRFPNLIHAINSMGGDVVLTRNEDTYMTLQTVDSRVSIDIYLCYIEDKNQQRLVYAYDRQYWTVGGAEVNWNMAMFIQNTMKFWIPNNPQHCLQCWYGPNWRTPVSKKDFYGEKY